MNTNPLRLLALLGTTLAVGCGYTPADNPGAAIPANVISGEIIANGVEETHTVVILVTDASNPMPPTGTGRPKTLATVNADEFTGIGAGVQSASYHVTNVPDGEWILTAVMDMDEDFHPLVDAMGGATCGDLGGGHLVDLETGELAVVSVSGGELKDDVSIVLGMEMVVERPAFYPLNAVMQPGRPTISVADWLAGGTASITLRSTSIHASWLDENGYPVLSYDLEGPYAVQSTTASWDPFLGVPVCETAFFSRVVDGDHDGLPDDNPDYPGLGLFDIWPHFGLIYLGTAYDVEGDGEVDGFQNDLAAGESWKIPAVASPIGVMLGLQPVGYPFLTPQISLIVLPAGQHAYPSEEGECTAAGGEWLAGICTVVVMDPTQLPKGAWSITAIAETGQTWTVPNMTSEELGAPVESTSDSFLPETQFNWVWLTE